MLVMVAAGETLADVEKRMIGQSDFPLTEMGKTQIHDVSETLAPYDFDHIYSSDLYRAQEVLRSVLKQNQQVRAWSYAEELRERSGGSYEGMQYSDIRKGMSPKQYRVWERDPFEAPLHGESLIDVQDRMTEWVDGLKQQLRNGDDILVISHPDTIRVLTAMVMDEDLTEIMGLVIEPGIPYFYYGPF